jgi:hypothetical protein
VKTVEELTAENERLKNILKHLLAEKTGVYFICGEAGKVENDLPEYLVVCPQYGSDSTQAYVKQGKLTSPGW